MKKLVMVVMGSAVLAGCASPAQRMSECQAQGISKDTCYMAEVHHKEAINQAAYNAQWANARDAAAGTGIWAKKDKNVKQHAQNAKKAGVKHWNGMKLEVTKNGLIVDGKPAAVNETNREATVYQQGLFSYVVYANGKIAVMDDKNQFQGYAK